MKYLIVIFVLVVVIILFYLYCTGGISISKYNTSVTKETISSDPLSEPYLSNGTVNMKKIYEKKIMDHKIQAENLLLLKKFLETEKIRYYIDCGTLLGAVRDKGFISGDTDADISVSRSDIAKIRSKIKNLESLGFISFRNSNSWIAMSLLRKGEYIDFYTHWQTIPFELSPYPFLETTFLTPKYYDEYLTEQYGNWRLPDPKKRGSDNWEAGMKEYVKNHNFLYT